MSRELLLQWASERGEGSWSDFSRAYQWAMPGSGAGEAASFLRTLSMLGHLEIDWASGNWSVAPTVVTLLPDAGGHGLVTGARTGALRAKLISGIDELTGIFAFFKEQDRGPDVCFVACDSERELMELAGRLDAPYEHSVAERLGGILPSIDAMLASRVSTPGVPDLGIEQYDPLRGRWRSVERDRAPGLYRYERRGRRQLRWRGDGGGVFDVDLAIGAYAELRRTDSSGVLRWYATSLHGSLGVNFCAPLPGLHARTAAMCSGLAPLLRGRLLMYPNVPRRLAENIATSLDQNLTVMGVGGEVAA